MFKELKKNKPLMILTILLLIIIIIGVFSPRNRGSFASLSIGGHIGSLKGKINLEAFENSEEPSVVLFHAPWCGHCKKLMPTWNNIMSNNKSKIKIIKINCDKHKDISKKYGIKGFPTIKYLPNGLLKTLPDSAKEYTGDRSHNSLTSFISKCV
tara:strand:+ start:78 stop:539 length:462 start_codon:yes stop_codon:yes gene_type:complete